ncbi:Protein NRT1/PTR FAMILY 2.11 [Forsythia ovata]|uniref:Protein NRT1/PTR FAMILY 2.11 n=1 Tax=Forsythia ovata TaxID=205694 RepID=A0ABD1TT10_9LAMI
MEVKEKTTVVNEEEAEGEINYRGIKAMPFIIGNETFEKLGAIGTLHNLQIYLTTFFNMKRITATTLLNVFNGTTNFATLLGAYLCDTYFGRYNTLGFGSIASFLGLLLITLTATFKKLHPPHCGADDSQCIGPTAGQMAFLLTGFGFMMVSVTLVVYVQSDVSWPIGLAIPSIFMLVSCFLFYIGTKIYVKVKPEGSPLTSICQVLAVAYRKRRLKLAEQPWLHLFNYTPLKSINSKLPYTEQFRFLDKAAIKTPEDQIKSDGSAANPWRICSMQQVEEVKCVLRVIPIWAAAILYHVGEKQQYVVFQAMQSNRHLGSTTFQIPPATYAIFSMLSLSIWVPIYDRLVVPFLRRVTKKEGGITVLQRMGIGIFLTILESLVAAFVEQHRRNLAISRPTPGIHSKRGDVSPMSALWLVPQLSLAGLAEAFAAIGQVEFYYKQFPENMRSIAGSFFFCGMAAASYLNGFLISLVHRTTEGSSTGNWLPEDLNKGRLDYFYYLITALCVLNLCYFLVCAKWYRYKGTGSSIVAVEMEAREFDKPLV